MSEKWFGSVYEGTGSTSKDLLLKTRGQIKIQIGKKFIDLLDKNGNIASKNNSVFTEVSSIDEIKDSGIYLCENSVYVKINDNILQLTGDEQFTYVSYLSEQNTTSEQKDIAKKNIGIQFDTIEEAREVIDQGLVFVHDKIYYISGTSSSEYTSNFPNPFTDQLIINKNNTKTGALLIQGDKEQNGISFNSNSNIYELNGELNISNKQLINLLINDNTLIEINSAEIKLKSPLIVDTINSSNYSTYSGFQLNSISGKSILTVDKVIERDKSDQLDNPIQYSKYYLITNCEFSKKLEDPENPDPLDNFEGLSIVTEPGFELNNNDVVIVTIKAKFINAIQVPDGEIIRWNILNEYEDFYIFELLYNSKYNIFYFLQNGEIFQYNTIKIDTYNAFEIEQDLYLCFNKTDICNRIIGRNLYVKAEQNNPHKFKFDYNSSSIAIEENIPDEQDYTNNKLNTRVQLGNVLEYTTESERRSEYGLFSDQSILNGVEFRGPVKEELVTRNTSDFTQEELDSFAEQGIDITGPTINVPERVYRGYDFPRYSSELQDQLYNVTNFDTETERIIPSIKWVIDYISNMGSSGYYVQSNWAETNSANLAFIRNKPTIPTKTSDLQNDSGFLTQNNFVICTQAQYDSMQHSPDVFYFITS